MKKEKMFYIESIESFLNDLDENLEGRLKIFMIGGGAMCLKNLKDATFDIDLIVMSRKDFNLLHKAMLKLGYDVADKELFKEAIYKNAIIVFQKGPSRVDIFIKNIVSMMDFSEHMTKRVQLYEEKKNLTIYLASNTDIMLLKSLSDRDKDFPDIERLIREGVDWTAIIKECDLQGREGVKWIFFVYEQLCRVENHRGIKIEGKKRIFEKCKEYWDQRPSDFMIDIDNLEKHIPDPQRKDVIRSLQKSSSNKTHE